MLSLYVSNDDDHVTFSNSGVDVLDFLGSNKDNSANLPDIIFLDINMPIMNGWDFLERFKRIQKKLIKPMLIYVISSSIDPADMIKVKKISGR